MGDRNWIRAEVARLRSALKDLFDDADLEHNDCTDTERRECYYGDDTVEEGNYCNWHGTLVNVKNILEEK